MTKRLRILVCGGRDYNDRKQVASVLDTYLGQPLLIIHGAARGADSLADAWAKNHEQDDVRVKPYPAKWLDTSIDPPVRLRNAGPVRNALMLAEGKPDLVIAFPGGTGTDDMVKKARRAGVRVRRISTKPVNSLF